MAPALTEPGQTQNLKLLPSHSSPASPTAAVRAVSDEIFFCDVARHLKSDNILNGNGVCINGTKLKNGLGNLKPSRPRLIIPAESCLTPCLDVSDCKGENGERSFMMNSDSSNQDQSNNMGLQKSHPGMTPSLEAGGFLKESFLPPEVDQLFKNLGAAINSNDIGPNMDELLQVFKSMESTVEDGTLEEALSAAQEQVENVEGDPIFPISEGADLSSAFNFERDIFNELEMKMCGDPDPDPHMPDADTTMTEPAKECNANERIEEARKKQFQSERRCEFLLRRLRKLQSKTMGRHASEEINGLMKETQRLMVEAQTQAQSQEVSRVRPPRTITQMLRQFDDSAHSAANNRHPQHRYFGSGSSDRTATVPLGTDVTVVGPELRAEVEKVAGQLHTQFRMVENAMDSDVTASSSGGESCDEMVSYNNPHQQPLPIMKRAAWRWAQERAGVASRWTWLQAQISDLEYRIRQHTEIHRQIRLNKGEVKLGEAPSQDTSQTPNGFHTNPVEGVKEPPECMGATGTCRTRPFINTKFRKRRLLNTAGLHLVSKKAARPSNIRCGCRLPLACCALCTGRSDPTYPREQPEQLTVQERIALLDPAYHPVLSFPSADVPQSIHLEALMRTPEWQQKMQRAAHKSSQRVLERREREREREAFDDLRNKKHVVDHRKKYQRLKKPGHTLANIQKIKKKLGRKPKNHDTEALIRHKRKYKFRRNSSHSAHNYDDSALEELRVEVSGSGHPSPAPSPGDERSHFAERTESLRRKRENSYDIDNIVIPHSLASSARVEKLQYKEILTPKWRVVDPEPIIESKNNGGAPRRSSHESDVEDVSDETIIMRHERCEVEERKRFMAYVKNANARPRANRRTDSRAGSSGANTPDPMSPNTPVDPLGDGVSPITSPPATPGASTAEHDPCSSSSMPASISSHFARRSRTLSQSRFVREDYGRSATPDCDEVAPYEPRTFPLSDEAYEKMLKVMPDWYPAQPYVASNPSSVVDQSELTDDVDMQDGTDVVGESLPGTPSTDTDSAPGEGDEDPNDPEWTIGEKESAVKR
ncbi:KAT8 regulatory NSL complex subunit 1 isoform X1 [Thrips palmi]|uniref:KAT8 regulatory NSL complex subunit 1 isoform X1 n=1 Tax=Thrips palmi TaxID=161013 RepID=A0A6P8Y264_THRPL|nr:KAT8 regulatory NSL complex subunit 1 isoform X1 [Thrips palmi]XP_034233598.1 KAT8 regulatory NSL complex subunit 1 isoform X1 [Thrips palmi]XP_034233599.1 KAT8 regulatory NSL complex subunit 1 isoform X1 [Thrips palmi]